MWHLTGGQAEAACMFAQALKGHVGRSHCGRLRTEDGPSGSSEITTPLAFIPWISCGRIDANCSPSTCVKSARIPARDDAIRIQLAPALAHASVPFPCGSVSMTSSALMYLLYTSSRGKGRKLLQFAMKACDGQGHQEGTSPARGGDLPVRLRPCSLFSARRIPQGSIGL